MSALDRFQISYERIDDQARLAPTNPAFWEMLREPMPCQPIPVTEVFDEVIGQEEELYQLISSGEGELYIPAFEKNHRKLVLRICHDHQLFPSRDYPNGTTVLMIQDTSESLIIRQKLMQSRNETAILAQALHQKEKKLVEANLQLKEFNQTVRSDVHDLNTQVKKRTRELHNLTLLLLTTMAQMAEYRDPNTGSHLYRIGRLSVIIGKHHGLTENETQKLYYASLLHDVGKVGIADSILMKPGPLTPAEWVIMKSHVDVGAQILGKYDDELFVAARDIALNHHEHWDGNGYQRGIAGEAIPLMARICSVADTFDALLSNRPYKKAWPVDTAVEYIRARSGSQFDPAVIRSFNDALDDILKLHQEETENLELLIDEEIT